MTGDAFPATGPRLELLKIRKSFGRVLALDGAGLVVQAGEVHALLGENGAGKSTLMRIAYGLDQADAGSLRLDGHTRTLRSPRDARALGIGMVHQHFTTVPRLTVEENLRLFGGTRAVLTHPRAHTRRLTEGLRPDLPAELLSVAQKQRLEILKAIASGQRVLLLDEPTAVLTPDEVTDLLAWIREFAEGGGSAVLITHKLREALGVADRITVLRRGRVTLSGPAAEQTAEGLARAMLGEGHRPVPSRSSGVRRTGGPAAVTLQDVTLPSLRHPDQAALRGVTLTVQGGEILGVAAIEGAGQRELLHALAGFHTPAEGVIHTATPVQYIPGDRTTEGLIPGFTLTENAVLAGGEGPWISRGRWIRWEAARRHAAEVIEAGDVRADGPDGLAVELSGGNQQKFILGNALGTGPRVLVADNPTRGLDLRAAATIHQRLRGAADAGVAIVFHAADLDEVVEHADRIVVLAGGRCREAPPGAGPVEIGRLMLGEAPPA